MYFRTVRNPGRERSAYGLFSCFPERFSALFEDAVGGGRQWLAARSGSRLALSSLDARAGEAFFRDWREGLRERADSPAIRFLVYAAYEAGALLERLPEPKSCPPVAVLWLLQPDFSLCFDGDHVHLAARSSALLDEMERMLEHSAKGCTIPRQAGDGTGQHWRVTPGAAYRAAVARVREYIAAGDIFQANIARFWRMPFAEADLAALYARLRAVNPAPFAGWMRVETDAGLMHLLSASPERLFRVTPDGWVETRPIAGTRRRGAEDDEAMRRELLLSEKERAEHVMLVDLERNDLGRVCQPGTVEVNERMVVERYATVQHIVSNVRGRLRPECDVVDVFRAMFPGGTITGCPKVRCMEIIHELECGARGPYTGSMGYVGWDGSADMNILIRTFWHVDGMLHWAAGAGIVADSDPERELAETEHKAAGLLRALAR